jgi:acyl-coenzyme A thioesterase PaaI-like protein
MGMGATVMGGYMVTTTDLSVSYLKPMNGKRYIFQGEYTHVGRRMVRCISRAIDAETGVLCATAQISYMLTETKSRGIQV